MSFPIIPLCHRLLLADVMAELVVCHLRLLDISSCLYLQNSLGLQDLLAGLDTTVTSSYVLGSARRCRDIPFLTRISKKSVDQSRHRHQQILTECRIRNCVHLVEVNLL